MRKMRFHAFVQSVRTRPTITRCICGASAASTRVGSAMHVMPRSSGLQKKSQKRFGIAGSKELQRLAVPFSIIRSVTQKQFKAFQQRAAARKLEVSLTFEDFHRLRNGQCYYCGIEPYLVGLYCQKLGIKTPYITIDRKDN